MGDVGWKHAVRSTAIDNRSQRISVLLPLLSGMRHSKNTEALATAVHLQAAIRDLERLNDVEIACVSAEHWTAGMLRTTIIEILEKP